MLPAKAMIRLHEFTNCTFHCFLMIYSINSLYLQLCINGTHSNPVPHPGPHPGPHPDPHRLNSQPWYGCCDKNDADCNMVNHFYPCKIWASPRENLFSGCRTNRVSNRSPQLQRLARKLKFHLKQVYIWNFSKSE